MAERGPATLSLLVLSIAVFVAILSIPDVPGVHSAPEAGNKNKRRHAAIGDRDVAAIKQNFADKFSQFLSDQGKIHLVQSYKYLYMSNYFDQSDIALPGFSKYFKKASDRELDNANVLMKYINKRGGHIELHDIPKPKFAIKEPTKALERARKHEKGMNTKLLALHLKATRKNDVHLKHMLEDHFLEQKVDTIKELEDHISRLKKMGPNNVQLGVFIYDKQIGN